MTDGEVKEQSLGQDMQPQADSGVDSTFDDDAQKPIYNKIQVSDIVKREREKALEKGRMEAMMQIEQQQQQAQQAQQGHAQGQGVGLGGMQSPQGLSAADIERIIAEKAPQIMSDHVAQVRNDHVVNSFVAKMQAAEQKYPGLEEQLNKLDYSTLAPVVQLANDMENTADIMKELVDNPMKMGNLLSLMYAQPALAQKAMADLSHSIKSNQDAKAQEAQARDPMNQIKSSPNAGVDASSMSVADFRKMFRR